MEGHQITSDVLEDQPQLDAGARVRLASLATLVSAYLALVAVSLPLERALVAAFAGASLIVVSGIDLERRVIPNRIVLPVAAVVLLAQLALFPSQALEWLLAPLIAAALLALPQLFKRAWMGMGDVKLTLLLGVSLGWGVFGAIFLSFICVFPVALIVLARGGLAARKTMIPFGPFLSLGGLIVLIAPHLVLS
jgi:prepilin signal peptidase PulO-like enzyme (type II secretory pathway)